MIPPSIPIPLPGGLHGPLPKFVSVSQKLSSETISNIDSAVAREFEKFESIDLKEKTWLSLLVAEVLCNNLELLKH